MTSSSPELVRIVEAVRQRQRFVISSHSRPDGDSIGSQLAMAFALRALGKDVHIVNKDRAPGPLLQFPGVTAIQIADRVAEEYDAAIIMECGDLGRTGVSGLDRFFVINIDHHPGNTGYGRLNWFDPTAAACGEMVFDLIDALGVPLNVDIATHIYLAILTDTGSFHYSSISPRTFEICRRTLEADVDPVAVARNVYDSNHMGRLKLFGAVLSAMQLDPTGRIAIVYLDHEMAREAGGTYEDTGRPDQPAPHGERDRGGRLLQADRGRSIPRQYALEGRHRHRAPSRSSSAAAATRTPPAAQSGDRLAPKTSSVERTDQRSRLRHPALGSLDLTSDRAHRPDSARATAASSSITAQPGPRSSRPR